MDNDNDNLQALPIPTLLSLQLAFKRPHVATKPMIAKVGDSAKENCPKIIVVFFLHKILQLLTA